MTNTPTLPQLIKQAIEKRLLDMHTAFIGRIERYDHKTQKADIQPVVKDHKQEELPLLIDVPVLFPRADDFFISLPVKKNDFVQVIINQEALDNFLAEADEHISSHRRFSLQGAVAILGIAPDSRPVSSAHETNLVMGKDNAVQIHIDGNKIQLGSENANQALAIASSVASELELLRTAITGFTGTQFPPMNDMATKKVVAQ